MTPGMQMLVAVLSTGVATKIIDEIIRAIKRASDKKKNRGIAKMEREVGEMHKVVTSLTSSVGSLEEVDKVILHDRIWNAYETLQNIPDISVEDAANLDYLFGEYKRLGGNHKAEIMYRTLKEKPVRKGNIQ